MGKIMFGNELFDHWLNQKSLEILNKVEKEKISTEDMLILSLKAQTNHFHHMDQEFRGEFSTIAQNFKKIDEKFEHIDDKFRQIDKKFEQVDKRFEQVDKRFEQVDKRFEQVDKRFEQVDKRFEHLEEKIDKKFDRFATIMMWQGGVLATLISGIYFKLLMS